MFLVGSIHHSVNRGSNVTTTNDALALTVQPPLPRTWDLTVQGLPCQWHLLAITGDLFKLPHFKTTSSYRSWHLVAIEAHAVGTRKYYSNICIVNLYLNIFLPLWFPVFPDIFGFNFHIIQSYPYRGFSWKKNRYNDLKVINWCQIVK